MKKVMKKAASIMLAAALAVSGMTYTQSAEAATEAEEWKANAVTLPKEGALVGAGYIDVEFDNSMEGYTYTVYLDGEPMYWIGDDIVKKEVGEEVTDQAAVKTFTAADEGKTEVYTTSVSRHEITVKASKDAEEVISDTRTFYVSKKGMALGGDMSDKISLSKLNCSWYYNWAIDPFNNSIDAGVSHVPMMWGGGDDNKESMEAFTSNENYFLGFNEPDIKTQANMQFFDGIDTWKQYISPLHVRKVSPAPAAPGGDSSWLKSFMRGDYKCLKPDGTWGAYQEYGDPSYQLGEDSKTWVAGVEEEVDSVCLHYYRNVINLQGLLDAIDTLWETYHKPIWVTELSLFGVKGTTSDFSYEIPENRQKMAEFVQGIVTNLDADPRVERYCWFSYDVDSTNDIDIYNGSGATSMFEYATGLYTELGRLYSSIGNPEGYAAETISDDEMFVYIPPETTPESTAPESTMENKPATTVNQGTTSKPDEKTGGGTVQKPKKVILKSVKNVKKKSVKLAWKKSAGAKKYQIQFAMDKKFKKKVRTKTTKKLAIKIAKLKKNKKYFFRVRAYNSSGYGEWSKIKGIKVKK